MRSAIPSLFLLVVFFAVPSHLAAQPNEPAGQFRIVVVSDLNERYGDLYYRETTHRAVAQILELQPDLILVTGDMVAGQRAGLDHLGMWAAFHLAVTDPLSDIPMAVTPGNHDASSLSRYQEEQEIFAQQWITRPLDRFDGVDLIEGGNYPMRYSFSIGPVFVVALNATRDNDLNEEQIQWVNEQLSFADDERHPVQIVIGHLPLYPVAQDREDDYLLFEPTRREAFETILNDHHVTLYLSGHHHAFYPARHADHETRLVAMGCLGGGPRVLIGDTRMIEDPDDPTERSFVVIELRDGQVESIEAYHGPDFSAEDVVLRDVLPTSIGEGDSRIIRDDTHGQ